MQKPTRASSEPLDAGECRRCARRLGSMDASTSSPATCCDPRHRTHSATVGWTSMAKLVTEQSHDAQSEETAQQNYQTAVTPRNGSSVSEMVQLSTPMPRGEECAEKVGEAASVPLFCELASWNLRETPNCESSKASDWKITTPWVHGSIFSLERISPAAFSFEVNGVKIS